MVPGLGYEHYGDFYEMMGGHSTERTKAHFVQDLLPLIPGIREQLEAGIQWVPP